jgi:ketosteroid isomerase-like protein
MSIEQNKQLAADFLARFSAKDIAGALDFLAEDVTWWMAGKPELTAVSGFQNKEQMARTFYGMDGQFYSFLSGSSFPSPGAGRRVPGEGARG